MDFSYVEFPLTVDFNTFQAYFTPQHCKLPNVRGKPLITAAETNLNTQRMRSLRHLVLDAILDNWNGKLQVLVYVCA